MFEEHSARKIVNAPVFSVKELSLPVLLETGAHDEALRYYAQARAVSYAGEYLVYVAKSSLLLDLVHFKRTVLVVATFSNNERYEASLSLARMQALGDHVALSLTLLNSEASLAHDNERVCPLT